jgi:hypothetical protein
MYAIALYNNTAESDDELNFKKNDVLEVLELDYDGLEGWWLCKLSGTVGLAAGNRLKILNLKQNINRNSNSSTASYDSNGQRKADADDEQKVCSIPFFQGRSEQKKPTLDHVYERKQNKTIKPLLIIRFMGLNANRKLFFRNLLHD